MIGSNLFPRLVLPGEATIYDQLKGEKIHVLLSGQDTGGAYALFVDEVPPNGGPPLHIHQREDETFYVLEGKLVIQVAEEQFTVTAGYSAFLPRGVPHTFTNPGAETARALVVLTPSGLECFFIEVELLVTQAEPDMTEILSIATKYGIEAVGPPLSRQVKGIPTPDANTRIMHPEQARTYSFPEGDTVRILLAGEQTGGQLALLQGNFPPGSGAPLHCHQREDEALYILEGTLSSQMGIHRETAAAGTALFLPRNIPHDFINHGHQPLKALALIVPAGFENYFAELHMLFTQGELDDATMLTLAQKYGLENVQ
jgi:quercetin dioxygenase-like cupin family protein